MAPGTGWDGNWRLAARSLRRAPGFTALAVAVLALGIGANTALFSVIRAALLRPLPYPHPERLLAINGVDGLQFSPNFGLAPWLEQLHNLSAVAAVELGEISYAGGAQPVRLLAASVPPSFFAIIAIAPYGRGFTAADSARGSLHTAVIGDSLARQLGGHAALGRTLTLDGRPFQVVGIMPAGVDIPDHAQIWLPWPLSHDDEILSPDLFTWDLLGRLQPGATLAQARSELTALAARHDDAPIGATVEVAPWRQDQLGTAATMLWLLLAASGLVLLIACLDIAQLQVSRALDRQRETAIRAALGARRRDLLGPTLRESLLLAGLGGGLGIALAALCLPALRLLLPPSLPVAGTVSLDPEVVAFAVGVSVLSALVFGVFPALHAFGVDLRQAMAGGPIATGGGGRMRGLRSALVVGEVALALLLLAGSGLLLASLARLEAVPTGFAASHVLTAKLQLGEKRYIAPGARSRFYDAVLARVRALPGVSQVAFASEIPMAGMARFFNGVQAREPQTRMSPGMVEFSNISPDYFRTLQIPLLAGRAFADTDGADAPGVVIVSQALATRLWPGQNPLGKHLSNATDAKNRPVWREVVGVSGDARIAMGKAPFPALYTPLMQEPASGTYLLVRGAASLTAASLRQAVAEADANEPLSDIATETTRIARSTAEPRFRTLLLGMFAGLALLLSAAGIFGALAYWALRRTPEIGVRMALGASPASITRLVMAEAGRLLAIGTAIGLAAALGLSHLLTAFLFQVRPLDPWVLGGAVAVMTVVAALAALAPARRAARTDPIAALRQS